MIPGSILADIQYSDDSSWRSRYSFMFKRSIIEVCPHDNLFWILTPITKVVLDMQLGTNSTGNANVLQWYSSHLDFC